MKAMECGWITARQIEAARVAMTRSIKRGGKVWIRIFPDKPITKKPAETRMGKGKGNPEGWVAVVRPGRSIFEVEGGTEELAKKARARASAKVRRRPAGVPRPGGGARHVGELVAPQDQERGGRKGSERRAGKRADLKRRQRAELGRGHAGELRGRQPLDRRRR